MFNLLVGLLFCVQNFTEITKLDGKGLNVLVLKSKNLQLCRIFVFKLISHAWQCGFMLLVHS